MEDTIKESRPVSIIPGLGEFHSEAVPRFGEPRAIVRNQRDQREERPQEDSPDRELMHRLHEDMRRAVEEMRATQAATLTALSDLQTTLIRWIVLTGIVVIALLRLF